MRFVTTGIIALSVGLLLTSCVSSEPQVPKLKSARSNTDHFFGFIHLMPPGSRSNGSGFWHIGTRNVTSDEFTQIIPLLESPTLTVGDCVEVVVRDEKVLSIYGRQATDC